MLRRDTDVFVVLAYDGGEVACWLLRGGGRPDLAVVDGLAQLALAARRMGCSIQLRGARVELLELLELVGLGQVVTGGAATAPLTLTVEAGREPEGGEQAGVEEVVMPDDPVA